MTKEKKNTTEKKLNGRCAQKQKQNVSFYSKQDFMEEVPASLEVSLVSVTLVFLHVLSYHDVVHKIAKD